MNLCQSPIISINIIQFIKIRNGSAFHIEFGSDMQYEELVNNCPPASTLISIVIHGWRESYESTEWVPNLISNISDVRGGCVLFMDYSKYSIGDYGLLVGYFKFITDTLVNQLKLLETYGYSPDRIYMFGFSYGAHLAMEAAFRYGPRKISRVDGKGVLSYHLKTKVIKILFKSL